MTVNMFVSDLFFNSDHSNAKVHEKGKFVEFDKLSLISNADNFLMNLSMLGVKNLPTSENIVEDFLGRI